MDKLNLPSKEKTQQELSANEFQEKLYYWLLDQGLISDLKGHLRMQMVTAFQGGSTKNLPNRQTNISPKLQALSILVADFLLQMSYHYTLSVYVTEFPIIGQLFSQFSPSAVKDTSKKISRFSARDIEDILETLGFIPGSDLFVQILSFYQNSANPNHPPEPLLLCIIRALNSGSFSPPTSASSCNRKLEFQNNGKDVSFNALAQEIENKIKKKQSDKDAGGLNKTGDKDLLEGLEESSLKNSLKFCPITCLQEYMKRIHEEELCKVKEEEEAKYKKLLDDKLNEINKKGKKERELREWKEKIEAELNEREQSLHKLASQLRNQHTELSEKLMVLEMESQALRQRERQLKESQDKGYKELQTGKSEILIQKNKLNEAYERLAADQEAVAKVQRDLSEKESTLKLQNNMQQESNYLNQIQDQYSSLCQSVNEKNTPALKTGSVTILPVTSTTTTAACSNSNSFFFVPSLSKEDKSLQTSNGPASPPPSKMDVDLLRRVEDEKQELNDRIAQQRQRIDELTIRAADLSNQLQDAQVALQLATPHQMAVTTPPLTAPPTAHIMPRPTWPPHIGSGEETSFFAMQPHTHQVPPPTVNQQTDFNGAIRRSDARRRPRRMINSHHKSHHSSDESSTTTTDEMIEEARMRLRQLEQESNSIQRDFSNFSNRQNLDISPSILFHPEQLRTNNPFSCYRSTNYSLPFQRNPSLNSNGINNNIFNNNNPRSFASRISLSRPVLGSFFTGYDQHPGNIQTMFQPMSTNLSQRHDDEAIVTNNGNNSGDNLNFNGRKNVNANVYPSTSNITDANTEPVPSASINNYQPSFMQNISQKTNIDNDCVTDHETDKSDIDKYLSNNEKSLITFNKSSKRNTCGDSLSDKTVANKSSLSNSKSQSDFSVLNSNSKVSINTNKNNSDIYSDNNSNNNRSNEDNKRRMNELMSINEDEEEQQQCSFNSKNKLLKPSLQQPNYNKYSSDHPYNSCGKKTVRIVGVKEDDNSDTDNSNDNYNNFKQKFDYNNYLKDQQEQDQKQQLSYNDIKEVMIEQNTTDDRLEFSSDNIHNGRNMSVTNVSNPLQSNNSQENLSVEVLLQRTINTSSSSTQHLGSDDVLCNDEKLLSMNNSEKSSSFTSSNKQPLLVTQSLPVSSPKSYFTSENYDQFQKLLLSSKYNDNDNRSLIGDVTTSSFPVNTSDSSKDVWHDVRTCSNEIINSNHYCNSYNNSNNNNVKNSISCTSNSSEPRLVPLLKFSPTTITNSQSSPSQNCKLSSNFLQTEQDLLRSQFNYLENNPAYQTYCNNIPSVMPWTLQPDWLSNLKLINSFTNSSYSVNDNKGNENAKDGDDNNTNNSNLRNVMPLVLYNNRQSTFFYNNNFVDM